MTTRNKVGTLIALIGLLPCPSAKADVTAVQPARVQAKDPIPWIRAALTDGFWRLLRNDSHRQKRHHTVYAYAMWSAGRGADKAIIPEFFAALRDDDPEIRAMAALVLGRSGPDARACTGRLTHLLDDKNALVRTDAAFALGEIGFTEKKTIASLKRVLKDSDDRARVLAAAALFRHGQSTDEVTSILTKTLSDGEDSDARSDAIHALGRMGNDVVPYLLRNLADVRPLVRLAATGGLVGVAQMDNGIGQPFPREAIKALIAGVNDHDERVAAASIYALGMVGEPAKDAVPALMKCLKDRPWWVRASAARDLRAFGTASKVAVSALMDCRSDESEWVRRYAAESAVAIKAKVAAAEGKK